MPVLWSIVLESGDQRPAASPTGMVVTIRTGDGIEVQGLLLEPREATEGQHHSIEIEIDEAQAGALPTPPHDGVAMIVQLADGTEVAGRAFKHETVFGDDGDDRGPADGPKDAV